MLVCLGWVLFRAANLREAFSYFQGLTSHYGITYDLLPRTLEGMNHPTLTTMASLVLVMLALEWANRRTSEPLSIKLPFGAHRLIKAGVLMLIVFYGEFGATEFIYFQF